MRKMDSAGYRSDTEEQELLRSTLRYHLKPTKFSVHFCSSLRLSQNGVKSRVTSEVSTARPFGLGQPRWQSPYFVQARRSVATDGCLPPQRAGYRSDKLTGGGCKVITLTGQLRPRPSTSYIYKRRGSSLRAPHRRDTDQRARLNSI